MLGPQRLRSEGIGLTVCVPYAYIHVCTYTHTRIYYKLGESESTFSTRVMKSVQAVCSRSGRSACSVKE